MNKEIYNATMEELGGVANKGRKMTLGFLFENDYITFEQYEYLVSNYAIIAKPPSYFSTLWEKVKGAKKDVIEKDMFIMVKQETLDECCVDDLTEDEPTLILVPKKEK